MKWDESGRKLQGLTMALLESAWRLRKTTKILQAE
jgi:hypothetical protein